ncbi:SPOR domain-containing protein [Aliisedimentitalea scapharcae]|uniref:SPOR domain-containing protein n=1 Tax=Aliisedimentitalea scapharcae TaxID=1524259 RepID=A0ABZ2XWF6_9RHOB
MVHISNGTRRGIRVVAIGLALGVLTACESGPDLSFLKPADGETAASTEPQTSTKLVERDVEAPEVFQVTEAGLWDGRPSLGGVWVAHPDAKDPERVIIRNNANGKFVIGALFRREREIPGPRVQASSDAAAALGMLAGAPVELNVTALRRETVDEEPPVSEAAPLLSDLDEDSDTPAVAAGTIQSDTENQITEQALDPIAGAAAAIEASSLISPAPQSAPAATAAPKPAATPSKLDKPYIQIGIFSVETNANRTAKIMRDAGMTPTVYEQSSNGKKFWRVLVGPAQTKSERSSLLKRIQKTGFSDAYAVTN